MSRINRQAAREDAGEGHVLASTDTLRLLDELDVVTDILVSLVQQANAQKFQGNVEVDGDGFIAAYRMPCGPVHSAIAYLQGGGIVIDEFGARSEPNKCLQIDRSVDIPETDVSENNG